jgi:hypothetical protein
MTATSSTTKMPPSGQSSRKPRYESSRPASLVRCRRPVHKPKGIGMNSDAQRRYSDISRASQLVALRSQYWRAAK